MVSWSIWVITRIALISPLSRVFCGRSAILWPVLVFPNWHPALLSAFPPPTSDRSASSLLHLPTLLFFHGSAAKRVKIYLCGVYIKKCIFQKKTRVSCVKYLTCTMHCMLSFTGVVVMQAHLPITINSDLFEDKVGSTTDCLIFSSSSSSKNSLQPKISQ